MEGQTSLLPEPKPDAMKPLRTLLFYALALAVTPCAWSQTEQEPNNTIGQANALAYNTPITGSIGSCTPPDNSNDYFKAMPTTQGVMHVEVATPSKAWRASSLSQEHISTCTRCLRRMCSTLMRSSNRCNWHC